MKTFGTVEAQDYTVDEMYVSAPMSWQLISSSLGINVVSTDNLDGAVTIENAANDSTDFFENEHPRVNMDSGTYEYILYRSVKHLFYNNKMECLIDYKLDVQFGGIVATCAPIIADCFT